MIVLKILLWIILIILALIVLGVLLVLLALSLKVQIGFDYDEDGVRLRFKYGVIPLKVYPEMFEPEKIEKYKRWLDKLKRMFGPRANKMMGKVQAKAAEKKEKGDIKTELTNAEEFATEEARIAAEEARLDAELKAAEAEFAAAEKAEAEGTPLPGVDAEVSKLQSIKESLEGFDFRDLFFKLKNFISGFSFDSIVALFSYIGSQTGRTFGKVLRRIVIKQFCVGLTISGDDAAKTALKYGRISGIAFPAMGKLVTSAKVREYDLELNPDFLAVKDTGELHLVVAFRPLRLLTPFVGYMFKVGGKSFSFYKSYKKTKKTKAKAAKSTAAGGTMEPEAAKAQA